MRKSSEAKINKAAAEMPKDHEREKPAASRGGSEVGNERRADLRETGLKGAVSELERQHPEAYNDHGPHHGKDHHVRHEPLHGLRPSR